MVWSGVLASCPSSGTHLPGDFEQVTCESRDGTVAFQLVLKPLGRQGKVSKLLPQSPPDQLHFHLIYTGLWYKVSLYNCYYIFRVFLNYYYKCKNCSYIEKYKMKTNIPSPHQFHSPEGATVNHCLHVFQTPSVHIL